jgi:tetratricopeptide (TPR) repeat protein
MPVVIPRDQKEMKWKDAGFSLLATVLLFSSVPPVFSQQNPVRPAHRAASAVSPASAQAEILMRQGRLDEAKALLLEDLKFNSRSADDYDLLGVIASGQHDSAGAVEAMKRALQIQPHSARTLVNLGNIYVTQKQIPLAEQQFRSALRYEPANRDANYNLGVLLLTSGSAAEAIPFFERVRPANPATSFNLIDAYLKCKRSVDAEKLANLLSTQNSGNVQVHFSLGLLLASHTLYKPATLELERADALQPETFEILYNLGLAYLRLADYPKAELVSARAVKLRPEDPDALYLLAHVYSAQSRPLDALDLLVKAHKLAPGNTDIIYLMAQISISQNYYEDAIPLLQSGIALAPQRTDLRAALGESYFMAGKVEPSIAEFKALVEIAPTARYYALLGLSYRHLGRFDEAKQYFEQGLKLDPKDSFCLYNLGYVAERQGNSVEAEAKFNQALQSNPNSADALLELANIRIASRKFAEAETLLKRFVQVSRDPATGYYKLAMVERGLHETEAAERDLKVFQTLSKNAPGGPFPYEHLYDYLESRSKLESEARRQQDLDQLSDDIKKHPDQPQNLYMLAEAYLKAGKIDEARSTIAQLDSLSSEDFRTLTGIGVLLARHHLYDDAIVHFQKAAEANSGSDEVEFDLADALFRKGAYADALEAAQKVSAEGQKDDTYMALLGDIYGHLGQTARAEEIFEDAIRRNPDNDQYYLSLALVQFRANDVHGAKQTLLKGQTRVPGSAKIHWGLGIAAELEGNTTVAGEELERAVDLLPEWPGTYSTLGVFYYATGQTTKAKEVLDRFKNSNIGGLDVNRIEAALANTPDRPDVAKEPLAVADRQQLLQLALTLADKTL